MALQHTARNTQHAVRSMQYAARSTQYPVPSTHYAGPSTLAIIIVSYNVRELLRAWRTGVELDGVKTAPAWVGRAGVPATS